MTDMYTLVHKASFDLGHEEGYQKNLEHLWHAALTVDPDLESEGFNPEDLPQMIAAALDEAYAEGLETARTESDLEVLCDDLENECRELQDRVFDLQDRMSASRSLRKAREKKTRRRCREQVREAQRRLGESKERSKTIQHTLYVALKAAEERERDRWKDIDALKKKMQNLDFAHTVLQSRLIDQQRNNDTAEKDLGALVHMAKELNLPGSTGSDEPDYDRLVNVINECYSRVTQLEKWLGIPRLISS